jgi:hypothetical protein
MDSIDYDATTSALREMRGGDVIVILRRVGHDEPVATLHGELGTNEVSVEEVGVAALAASKVPGGPAPIWVVGGTGLSSDRGGGTFRLESEDFVRAEWGEPRFSRTRRPLVIYLAGDLRLDVALIREPPFA